MIDQVTSVVVWLNGIANLLGRFILAPIGMLPELVAATLVATVTGVVMLLVFKYTSNQRAVKSVRNDIKAQLLALSLFKDSVTVSLRAQGRILTGACHLLLLSLIPMAVMVVPISLLLGQLALWCQARPSHVGQDVVVTLTLTGDPKSPWPGVSLEPSTAIEATLGPVRLRAKRAICWSLRGKESGYHHIVFKIDGRDVEKEFAVGSGMMRVSLQRPERKWKDVLLHPAEHPFGPQSPVKSIEIQYPYSPSRMTGRNSWLLYWFAVSTIAALCFRGIFKVNL